MNYYLFLIIFALFAITQIQNPDLSPYNTQGFQITQMQSVLINPNNLMALSNEVNQDSTKSNLRVPWDQSQNPQRNACHNSNSPADPTVKYSEYETQ